MNFPPKAPRLNVWPLVLFMIAVSLATVFGTLFVASQWPEFNPLIEKQTKHAVPTNEDILRFPTTCGHEEITEGCGQAKACDLWIEAYDATMPLVRAETATRENDDWRLDCLDMQMMKFAMNRRNKIEATDSPVVADVEPQSSIDGILPALEEEDASEETTDFDETAPMAREKDGIPPSGDGESSSRSGPQ